MSIVLSTPRIEVGGAIPIVGVKESAADSASPLVLKGKNVIIGVPGAFTGTCHAQVPGYLDAYDEFKEKGVENIYIVAVNDVFVTKAWKENLAPDGSDVHFIADDSAAFSAALGLAFDASPLLGNPRSLRYVIVAEDGKVASLYVEPNPSKLTITAAKEILATL